MTDCPNAAEEVQLSSSRRIYNPWALGGTLGILPRIIPGRNIPLVGLSHNRITRQPGFSH